MIIIIWKDLVVFKGPEMPVLKGKKLVKMSIYWRDSNYPNGYGPFETAAVALKHYYRLKNSPGYGGNNTGGDLITVDFVSKSRPPSLPPAERKTSWLTLL